LAQIASLGAVEAVSFVEIIGSLPGKNAVIAADGAVVEHEQEAGDKSGADHGQGMGGDQAGLTPTGPGGPCQKGRKKKKGRKEGGSKKKKAGEKAARE
jgi:hypothetical protein